MVTSKISSNLNSKKDSFLLNQFCKGHDSSRSRQHSDHEPLDTIEADIQEVLNHTITDKSNAYYEETSSDQTSALLNSSKPWTKDPNYFREVHISSLALLKMTIHARSGGSIEIMGMLTGKIVKNGIVVMDVYPLPVEGTETRVNAQAEGYEFMVQYLESLKETGRNENIVGWYHSHPGYGCWLSGIDVSTQSLNQQFQDPYLAIVVDPERTVSNGIVEIGAFRTYTDEYVQSNNAGNNLGSLVSLGRSSSIQKKPGTISSLNNSSVKPASNIPDEKIKDFGLHSSKYYSLSIDIFKTDMDHSILQSLWSKYWIKNFLGDDDNELEKSKTEAFIQDRLTKFAKKLENLKKPEQEQQTIAPSIQPASRNTTTATTTNDTSRFQKRSGRLNISSGVSSLGTSLSSILNQTQLSPFTKANYLSKIKGKELVDTDGSDSEMNDADSDSDSNAQELEETQARLGMSFQQSPSLAQFRRPRRQIGASVDTSPTIPDNTKLNENNQDHNSSRTNNTSTEVTDSAAEAGRRLLRLKLQEIVFLNE